VALAVVAPPQASPEALAGFQPVTHVACQIIQAWRWSIVIVVILDDGHCE
jgi:hypothetical protein